MSSRYGLEIRSLDAADAGGLEDLLSGSGLAVDARSLAARIPAVRQSPGAALGAFEWGPPSGVVVVQWAPSLLADAPVARLELILVAATDRRRGVGRLLLKAAAQAARQAGCSDLVAADRRENAELHAFLTASGFDRLGPRLVRPLRKRT